ncbi:TPA: hypothetical protein ACG3QY_001798 [Clostridioides difficile]
MDEKILELLQEMKCRFDYIDKNVAKIKIEIEGLKHNTEKSFIDTRIEIDFIEKYLEILKDDIKDDIKEILNAI